MRLKELLKTKYGNLSQAARELGFNQGDLNKLVNNDIKIRIDTIQRLAVKGIIVTFKNGKIIWDLEK